MTRYDTAQTNGINAVRERMRSIAILSVETQEQDACGDRIQDLMQTIADDLKIAQRIAEHLSADRVYAAEDMALKGVWI